MTGEGTLTCRDREILYDGQFYNGKFHGKGRLSRTDNQQYSQPFEVYHGEWSHGRKNGQGMYNYDQHSHYTGEFRNDTKHGRGQQNFEGIIFEGDFQNDRRNGQGEMQLEDGPTFMGKWLSLIHI